MRKDRKNPQLEGLIEEMQERPYEAKIWRNVSKRLARPSSRLAEVNVSRIARHTGHKDVVAVPGKVLGSGTLKHMVTVAAYSFSKRAREKIESSGGECLSLSELAEREPSGRDVKIME